MTSDNPSRAIKCPSCGGSEVFSSDNQPLWHPRGISGVGTDETTEQYDNEIYVSFQCTDLVCRKGFEVVFDLTFQRYQ
jgi:hypothetical protein